MRELWNYSRLLRTVSSWWSDTPQKSWKKWRLALKSYGQPGVDSSSNCLFSSSNSNNSNKHNKTTCRRPLRKSYLIKHPIVTNLKTCSESQHIEKDRTNNYTCQEAVNTWCISSLPRQRDTSFSGPAPLLMRSSHTQTFHPLQWEFPVGRGRTFQVCSLKQDKKNKVCDFQRSPGPGLSQSFVCGFSRE